MSAPLLLATASRAEISGLLIFALFIGIPLVKAMLEQQKRQREKAGGARGGAAVPSAEPRQRREPISWRDILEGRMPQPPAVQEEQPDDADFAEMEEEPVSAGSFEDRFHEHEGPLVPDTVLGELPPEDELERHGGDRGAALTKPSAFPLTPMGEFQPLFSADEARLSSVFDDEGGLAPVEQAARTERAPAMERLRPRGGWKQAVVLAEVFGKPLATRPADPER